MATNDPIIIYTSSRCAHSWAVERFMKERQIPVHFINIDDDPEARQAVMALNDGYASVPTLIFPDGVQLTEPSFSQLRTQLGIQAQGMRERIRGLFGRSDDEDN